MPKWKMALCAASCVSLLSAGVAQADRRGSLAGNLLIQDQDDVFLFPNQVRTYRNLIALDYGLDSQTGNAMLTLGDERAGYGFSLHRGDALRPLGEDLNGPSQFGMRVDLPSLFSTADFPAAGIDQDPATMIDFSYGRDAGSFDWGLRAAFGRGALVVTDDMDNDTGAEQLYFMGQFGYGSGVRGEDTRTDLSLSLLADLGKEVAGGDNQASALGLGFNGLMRMYIPMQAEVDLGVLANLAASRVAVENQTVMPSSTHSRLDLGLGGGVGAAMRFGRANVAAYATLRFDFTNEDADSETSDNTAEVRTIGIVVPGLLASVEVPVTDWFFVRTGAQYDYDLTFLKRGDDSGGSQANGAFGWNAGLGVLVDDFRFDGTLSQGFVTNGPNFIGGGNGFLAMASLTYVFDKGRDGMNYPVGPEEGDSGSFDAGADMSEPEPGPTSAEPPPPGPAVVPAPTPPPAGEPAPGATGATEASGEASASGGVGVSAGGSVSTQ